MTTYASTIYNFVGRRLSWSNGANAEQSSTSHDQEGNRGSRGRPLSLATALSNLTAWDAFSMNSDSDYLDSESDAGDALSDRTLVTTDSPPAFPSPDADGTVSEGNTFTDNTIPRSQSEASTLPSVDRSGPVVHTPEIDTAKPTPLPEDDGHSALRRQLLGIHRMDIPEREKALRMHALMTEKYNASRKQKQLQADTGTDVRKDGLLAVTDSDAKKTYHKDDELGCTHYKRGVKLQCSSCTKWYTCRFCHDEQEDHNLIRRETKYMLCMHCGKAQPAQQDCKYCGVRSAKYYCDKCKLWDDDPQKNIYHCDDCGICRTGAGLGKDFFHCKKCGVCMPIKLQTHHRCIERSTECDCPICGEYLFTSTMTVVNMVVCGHSIHHKCYDEYKKTSYRCPTCAKTIVNMQSQFRALDNEVANQPLQPPYDSWRCLISCNDCSTRSNVPFHFLGLKCDTCLSYNTNQVKLIRPEDNSPHSSSSYRNANAVQDLHIASPLNSIEPHGSNVPIRSGASSVTDPFMNATVSILSDAVIGMTMEGRLGRGNLLLYDDGWDSPEEDSSDESARGLSDGNSVMEGETDDDEDDASSGPVHAQFDVEDDDDEGDEDEDDDDDDDDDFLQLTGHR